MIAGKHTTHDRAGHKGPARRVRAAITMDRATEGLVAGRLVVAKPHVVFVKGVVEASEGLAALFAERGGDLTIAAPAGRHVELYELLSDLASELGGTFELDAEAPERAPVEPEPSRSR